jgi:hypothetical protein
MTAEDPLGSPLLASAASSWVSECTPQIQEMKKGNSVNVALLAEGLYLFEIIHCSCSVVVNCKRFI